MSHDFKTDHPFNLCHLVFQGQDVTRMVERAAEVYRTFRFPNSLMVVPPSGASRAASLQPAVA